MTAKGCSPPARGHSAGSKPDSSPRRERACNAKLASESTIYQCLSFRFEAHLVQHAVDDGAGGGADAGHLGGARRGDGRVRRPPEGSRPLRLARRAAPPQILVLLQLLGDHQSLPFRTIGFKSRFTSLLV